MKKDWKDISAQKQNQQFKAIGIGVSAGGMDALKTLLPFLSMGIPAPVIIVQHLHPSQDGFYLDYYSQISKRKVVEVEDKEPICAEVLYFSPPNYHLYIDEDGSFSLSVDEKVNYCRPSIDLFFYSAVEQLKEKFVSVLLTGANQDGADGMRVNFQNGGLTIVQDPTEAEYSAMPKSAIQLFQPDAVLPLNEIGRLLQSLNYDDSEFLSCR